MKTLTIPLANGEKLLLVEVPEDARGFCKTESGETCFLVSEGMWNATNTLKHDFNNFLGTYSPETNEIDFEVRETYWATIYLLQQARFAPLFLNHFKISRNDSN